jgi:probable phosphoglycerate mutase
MTRIVLIRPGMTDYDAQCRITGNLDIPLNAEGARQAARMTAQLSDSGIELIYSAPSQAAMQTAEILAAAIAVKVKRSDKLRNIDQGLWQGLLVSDVKQKQPKVFRQWQDRPETICPPQGETLGEAQVRIEQLLSRIIRRHRSGTIAIVTPGPLACLVESQLRAAPVAEYWEIENQFGTWNAIEATSMADSAV